ncbi:DUF3179 domain-containing protein [Vibrio sp. WXL210]|uniref:DUF3179 domain-containing protein n=1 Tax=Vibrio sp. WXL210 TaxID=3450709 RepID=UPI003EC4D072
MKTWFVFWLSIAWLFPLSGNAASMNGFKLNNLTVPADEILSGGPGKDGIPALLEPKFQAGTSANFLSDSDIVLGIHLDGVSKAYPIAILNWHEIVNDRIGDRDFIVSYCPLCGSGMAFQTNDGQQIMTFGVSGLLYNSDVLMYDHQSESLWSQIRGAAVSGERSGQTLVQLPLKLTRWQQWLSDHPDTQVLSTDTGYSRDYQRDPYAGYSDSPFLYFPVAQQAPSTYSTKETVLGFHHDGFSVAFPFSELRANNQAEFTYPLGEQDLKVHWDESNQSAWITDANGQPLASTLLYWFAWYAFYPETKVFSAQ